MKRIFKVKLSNAWYQNDTRIYEVVANDAMGAVTCLNTIGN